MNEILKKNQKFGIDLSNMGIKELAWSYPFIISLLNDLSQDRIKVLGGDVLTKTKKETFIHTGDNWNYEENNSIDNKGSIDYAINYIKNYVKKNGEDYFFVVCEDAVSN